MPLGEALGVLTIPDSPGRERVLNDPIAFPDEEYIDFEGTLLVLSCSRCV